MNQAATALAIAKQNRQSWHVYQHNSEIEEKQDSNGIWSRKLKSPIAESRIVAFYQPIIHNQTKAIVSYEALIRLIEPDGNVATPNLFLEVAEKNRQYAKLTKMMVDQVIQFALKQQINVSINLTLEDIYNQETQNYLA